MKYQTLVVRGDNSTVAIVKAHVPKSLANDTAFLAAIVRAITEWVKDTDNGKAAWERSSQDFNVGDLSGELEDIDLQRSLVRQGIEDLSIDVYNTSGGNNVWTYDTVLVIEEDIEEDDDSPDICPELDLIQSSTMR